MWEASFAIVQAGLSCFRERRTNGPTHNGWITGATRTHPGCPRVFGSELAISRLYWDADTRLSWTSARLPGESPPCGRWPRGATDFNDTMTLGSFEFRGSSFANGT